MKSKDKTKPLPPNKEKLAKKIHKWAFLDAKKYPQKFAKQFDEICIIAQFPRER